MGRFLLRILHMQTLVQIMVYYLFVVKPLSDPVLVIWQLKNCFVYKLVHITYLYIMAPDALLLLIISQTIGYATEFRSSLVET